MLTTRQTKLLEKAITLLQQILADADKTPRKTSREKVNTGDGRTKRSGKDAAAFKKQIKAGRKKGERVSELAKQHGVTPSYIYQLLRRP